tara:strand:+ start:1867 stop:2145 length:279 start_codon:yes stop_codon:yes gene_type:complete
MVVKILQKILRWMPIILLVLLFMVDRKNTMHKFGYIVLLISYSGILILRLLYAKKEWHREFNTDGLNNDGTVNKMSDYQDKLNSAYKKNKSI